MSEIVVLGAGRIGQAIARDLAADPPGSRVQVADRSPEALARLAGVAGIETVEADLSDPRDLTRLVDGADLAVGALASALGYRALDAMIEAGCRYVDVSFFAENPLTLDGKARAAGVTAVVDAGLAPGLSNLIAGHLVATWDAVDRFDCCVGGLPVERRLPWEYAAPFAPIDVIAEYTRPARRRERGEPVVEPALSGRRTVDLPGVGTLEAFDTDGLRTLLDTLPEVPDLREQTLRYPGHADKIRLLRDSGFFSPEPSPATGVSPLAATAEVLIEAWRLGPEDVDLAVMRVEAEGRAGGRPCREVWDLLDYRDPETGLSAMARTTGFACTSMARRVLAGDFERAGVSAPEHMGRVEGCFEKILAELEARDIRFRRS